MTDHFNYSSLKMYLIMSLNCIEPNLKLSSKSKLQYQRQIVLMILHTKLVCRVRIGRLNNVKLEHASCGTLGTIFLIKSFLF